MGTLRQKIIRLAQVNPDLRPHLTQLLKNGTTPQVLLWIPERTRGAILVPYTGPKPTKVWTLFREMDPNRPPALPITPVHGVNASFEDVGHDWKVAGGTFRYSSQSTDGNRWLLLEFDA